MFAPATMVRERILAFGPAGASKTYSWLMTAKYLQEHGNPAIFYVLDTDDSVERMLTSSEFRDLRNLRLYHCYSWPSYERSAEEVCAKAEAGDWIVVDLVCNAWDAVQRYYVEQVHHKDMGDFFLELRQESGDAKNMRSQLARDQMWVIVNKLYYAWINPLVFESRAHLFMCASVSTVHDTDGAEIKAMFRGGIKPAGQKRLPHQFHTILYFQCPRVGQWLVTTIKDRERPPFEGAPLKNFPLQYLGAKAGWREVADTSPARR